MDIKRRYYEILDARARDLADLLAGDPQTSVTALLLDEIGAFYKTAKTEKALFGSEGFEVAYHAPVTPDLELLLARILLHYSDRKSLGWKIYLRRQTKQMVDGKAAVIAPDIRVEKDGRTLAIAEVKAKVGWMQPFFSSDRVARDLERRRAGKSDFDPEADIAACRRQIQKYALGFNIEKEQVFMFIPTLSAAHRKKSARTAADYEADFVKNSHLGSENLILLSRNLELDLAREYTADDLHPTNRFERFVKKVEAIGKQTS